jgi:DNA-binding NarL/FixJ family response regulator
MVAEKKAKSISVLIVEDSLLIARKLKAILSTLDFVHIAGHAKNYNEAFAILGIIEPDVIILDIQMPGKSGINLLTEIRLKHLNSRVVIFTNHSDPYYRNLCNQLGADYFLDKSTEFEKIPVILDYYINR